MASRKGKTHTGAKVPVERPDREAAERDPGKDAVDRPGFDLGGAKDPGPAGKMRNPPSKGAGRRPGPGASGAPDSGADAGRRGKPD